MPIGVDCYRHLATTTRPLLGGFRTHIGCLIRRLFSIQVSLSSPGTLTYPLRPYQEDCINTCLQEYAKGIRRQAVSLPVGSGKTVIFANLIKRLPPPRPNANKVLVLAHREELLIQAHRQVQRFVPDIRASIEMGKNWSDHENVDVVIASVATLGRSDTGLARLSRFKPEEFKCIIIDEAHHSVTESYNQIMKYFGVDEGSQEILVWGCSATLSRNDELALGNLFDKIVYHKDMGEMIKEGWLCRADYKQIYTNIDLKSVPIRQGDFFQRDLSLAIDTPTRNELVAATWYEKAHLEHQRKATIVFGLTVQHVFNLQRAFSLCGVQTAVITGETDDDLRKDTLSRFAKGEIPVLLNCAVLTEGTDLPITDCVVLTRPTCNSNLFIQMVGRGLRKYEGKEYCLVLDFIDEHRSRNRNLLAHPTLEASMPPPPPPTQSTDSDAEPKEAKPRQKICFEDINADNIEIKVRSVDTDTLVFPRNGHSWFKVDEGLFAVDSPDGTFVLQVKMESPVKARILTVESSKRSPKFKEHKVSDELSSWRPYGEVLSAFSQFVQENNIRSTQTTAYWKRRRPLSSGQRQYLLHLSRTIPNISGEHTKKLFSLPMGTASDLISKYHLRTRYLKKPFADFDDWMSGVNQY